MAKATWKKVSGTWRQITNVWRNNFATWEDRVVPYINVSEIWRDCMIYPPATPSNGPTVNQPAFGGSVNTNWGAISGATYYRLYRRPYYNGATWVDDYEEQYTGANLSYVDAIQDEERPADGTTLYYRYKAGNSSGDSDFSPISTVVWYEM